MVTPLVSSRSTNRTASDAPHSSLRLHGALRSAGLRPTFHRLYVMRVLDAAAPAAVTAEVVYQQLCDMEIAVSQATVYRALNELEQHGLLARMRLQDASDNKVRYAVQGAALPMRTCAFRCPVCQEESAITDPAFCDQLQRQAQVAGFDRHLGAIHVAMTCNRCA